MEKENNKLSLTIIWSSCIFILLLMVGLGASSSVKGTSAAGEVYGCPSGYSKNTAGTCCKSGYHLVEGYCCPSGYNYFASGWGIWGKGCYKAQYTSYEYDVNSKICTSLSDPSDVIPKCGTTDYHNPVDVEVCSSGYDSESGVCTESGGNDTEDGSEEKDKIVPDISVSISTSSINVGEEGTITIIPGVDATLSVSSNNYDIVDVKPIIMYNVKSGESKTFTFIGKSKGIVDLTVELSPSDSNYLTRFEDYLINVTDSNNNDTGDGSQEKITPNITLDKTSLTIVKGDKSYFEITSDVAGKFIIESSGSSIATANKSSFSVDSNDEPETIAVNGVSVGGPVTIILKFTPTDTNRYSSITKTVSVNVVDDSNNNPGNQNPGGYPGYTPSTSKWSVTFDANGGILNGKSSDSCSTTGSSCYINDLPTASKDGYTFNGWNTTSTCTSGNKDKLTLSSNITYYACYTSNSGGVDTDEDGNVTENVGTGEITIALVWFAGLFAMAYAVYYFKQVKQN